MQTQPSQDFKYGNAIFDSSFSSEIRQILNFSQIKTSLISFHWWLQQHKITQHEGHSIFHYMNQARCDLLAFNQINTQSLYKQILSVKYVKLISLNFYCTTIQNLQILTFFDLPLLKNFYLSFCQINNTKSLSKTHWPNIQLIIMNEKEKGLPVRKQFLAKIQTNRSLKSLGIGWIQPEFYYFSKLQAQNIIRFQHLLSYGYQPAFHKALLRKYPQAQIQRFTPTQDCQFRQVEAQ